MGRKTLQTVTAGKAIEFILAKSRHPIIKAVTRGLNDAWREDDCIVLGFINRFHATKALEYIEQLEKLFKSPMKVIHLYMLEEAMRLNENTLVIPNPPVLNTKD